MLRLIALILLAVFVYYYLRYVFRLLGIIKTNKQQKHFRKESGTKVHSKEEDNTNGNFSGGEYIDYEEVDK